jgi:hypothetical protein
MAYGIKTKKTYRVGIFTRKEPVQVNTFNIEAKNEKEAEKYAKEHKEINGEIVEKK